MALTPPPSPPPAAPPAPGSAPSRADPSTFRNLADAFVVWLVGFRDSLATLVAWLSSYVTWAGTHVTELSALQADVGTKQASAGAAAAAAASSATAASSSAGQASSAAATAGAAAIEAQTVISPVSVANYAGLRAYAGTAVRVSVTGYLVTATPSGIAGEFVRDDSDTTSADNNGTIIVASNGKRWKRSGKEIAYRPEWFGAIGDGTSHPLSTNYGSLAAAQVDYPHAAALTDEIDWCAWRSAVQAIYDAALPGMTASGQNFAHGRIEASGKYLFNRTLKIDVLKVEIEGKVSPRTPESVVGESTWIKYTGADGTVDAPVFIFDCHVRTETGGTPAGRLPQTRGVEAKIKNLGFFGKFGSMSGAPSASGFVSAIRIRQGVFCEVKECAFGGTLYDAIAFTGPQLFPIIEGNFFYGVHRDAIANQAFLGDFSTTIWIRDNEFGFVGRYAILLDMFGSVEAMPVITNNSFEHSFASYYVANRSWFVHGAITGVCVIGGGNMSFRDNRFEGITGITAGYLADVHIVNSTAANIEDCTFRQLLVTTNKGSQPRSTAFNTYLTANGTSDITDTRTHLCGTLSDFYAEMDGIHIRNIYNMGAIIIADGRGFGSSTRHVMEGTAAVMYSLPVVSDQINPAGTQTKIAHNFMVGIAAHMNTNRSSVIDATTTAEPVQLEEHEICLPNFSVKKCSRDNVFEYQFFREFWLRFANYPTQWNGYRGWVMHRLAGDMSAPANCLDEPLFYSTPHNSAGAAIGTGYYETDVIRSRKIRYEFTAAPATGTWTQGDIVYHKNPAASGFIGWVCVAGGTPGTWKTFGAISA